MCSAELWETGSEGQLQNENISLHRESNQRHIAFQPDALNHETNADSERAVVATLTLSRDLVKIDKWSYLYQIDLV